MRSTHNTIRESQPSLLLANGAVFDGKNLVPGANAVFVADGTIAAVGDVKDLRTHARETRDCLEIDARGALIHPAFTDAHVHPAQAGVELQQCDLSSARSAEDALALVAHYSLANNESDWIIGSGWSMAHFSSGLPTAELLDRVCLGRPVYLVSDGHHSAWLSSEALRRLGIDHTTPDPAHGRIDRRPDGTPSGTLHESAMELGRQLLPVPDIAEIASGIEKAQSVLLEVGVTAWQDAIVGDYAGSRDSGPAYRLVAERGVLRSRASAALWLDRELIASEGVQAVVSALVTARDRLESPVVGHPGIRADTVKVMVDGVLESRTAVLSQPYASGGTGDPHFEPDVLTEAAVALSAEGFSLHFHTIGDGALTLALDAIEHTPEESRARLRHQAAHVQLVSGADAKRMSALGVTANLQMLWACDEEEGRRLYLPEIGPERYAAQYPFASLEKVGVRLAAGSDWPVSSPDPWRAIAVGVRRSAPGAGTLAPEEALTVRSALAAYTSGSARVLGFNELGSLDVGTRADLVVTNHDPFREPDALGEVRARVVVREGRLVMST